MTRGCPAGETTIAARSGRRDHRGVRPGRALVSVVAAVLLCAVAAWWVYGRLPSLPGARVGHVVLVTLDGLRPDAIAAADAPTLQRLLREGAYSLTARTIVPSTTLPSHASMLTGLAPARHGITWNWNRASETGPFGHPTILDLVAAAGGRAAAYFGKDKFGQLTQGREVDFRVSLPEPDSVHGPRKVALMAGAELILTAPNLLVVHMPSPDVAGHEDGWMSPRYLRAVAHADRQLGLLLSLARARFGGDVVLIVTADHGGHDRQHEAGEEPDLLVPWIAWGAGVRRGRVAAEIRPMDTAATILWLLDVPAPPDLDGRPVVTAFRR